MTTANRSLLGERNRIVELANKHRLPAIYTQKAFIDAGGLMSYGVDYTMTCFGARLFTWTRS
jgi:ABC-type uncharacterized transport system substrate-binding protein